MDYFYDGSTAGAARDEYLCWDWAGRQQIQAAFFISVDGGGRLRQQSYGMLPMCGFRRVPSAGVMACICSRFFSKSIRRRLSDTRQQKWPPDGKSVDVRGGCVNRNDLQTTNLLTVGMAASTEMTFRQQIC